MRFRSLLIGAASVALAVSAAACGDDVSPVPAAATAAQATGAVTVFAAASLTESFTEIAKQFEAENPQARVTFNFGASSALVTQINEGAPADVFASADSANMKKLTDAGGNGTEPVTFAKNKLTVIVERGNPKNIGSVKDLTDPNLLVVVAAPQVPAGAYSAEVFEKAGITVTPVSMEENVKAVVTKVTSGEADAGIVYTTDVNAAGDSAASVAIPDELNVIATYPVAVTKDSANPTAAAAFIDFIVGAKGQATLAKSGFTAP